MKIIPFCVFVLVIAMVSAFGYAAYEIKHSPRIEVTNGQIAFHVVHGRQLDAQTFAVPCQIGDFFRINANKETVITTFAPTSNGWAIIHFEYLK